MSTKSSRTRQNGPTSSTHSCCPCSISNKKKYTSRSCQGTKVNAGIIILRHCIWAGCNSCPRRLDSPPPPPRCTRARAEKKRGADSQLLSRSQFGPTAQDLVNQEKEQRQVIWDKKLNNLNTQISEQVLDQEQYDLEREQSEPTHMQNGEHEGFTREDEIERNCMQNMKFASGQCFDSIEGPRKKQNQESTQANYCTNTRMRSGYSLQPTMQSRLPRDSHDPGPGKAPESNCCQAVAESTSSLPLLNHNFSPHPGSTKTVRGKL